MFFPVGRCFVRDKTSLSGLLGSVVGLVTRIPFPFIAFKVFPSTQAKTKKQNNRPSNLVPRIFAPLDQRLGNERPWKVFIKKNPDLIGNPKISDLQLNYACLAAESIV